MLGKLLKYDMRYVARIMPLMYSVALAMSLLMSLVIFLISKLTEMSFILVMMLPLWALALAVVAYSGVIMIASRIYKTFYSDQGYLTFTLPVTSSQLIWSKVLLYVIWQLIGIIVALVCVALPIATAVVTFATDGFYDAMNYILDFMTYFFKEMFGFEGATFIGACISMLVYTLVSYVSAPIAIIFSFSIGQFVNKHRVIAAIGIYFAYSTVMSILFSILELFIYIPGIMSDAYVDSSIIGIASTQLMWYMIFCSILTIIVSSICYVVTKHIMANKLNLI